MIGGTGVQLAGVIRLGGVDGEIDAGDLREAADRLGRAVGGGFKRLEQLRAGDVDDSDGVAEGQDRVDVLLRDVAGLDGRTDAAAVGQGDGVVGIDLQPAVLGGVPEDRVGDEVAVVRLAVTVAVGGLRAVELDKALGEGHAVLGFDLRGDLRRSGGDGRVGGRGERVVGQKFGFHVISLDGDAADVGEFRAGGGQHGVADLAGVVGLGKDVRQRGVGVRVDENVDARDLFKQVDGAVADGLVINAEVAEADDDIALVRLERVHLSLRELEHLFARGEGHALDLGGVGLGRGLGCLQAEHADLRAVRRGEGHVILKRGLAVIKGVGGEDGELCFLGEFDEIFIAVVKLVIAERGGVIAGHVHQLDGRGALGKADRRIALNVVARVKEQHVGALFRITLLQSGHLRVMVDLTMHVVGVQDNDAAFEAFPRGRRRNEDGLLRAGRYGQRKDHRHCQQQGQKFAHSFFPPENFCRSACPHGAQGFGRINLFYLLFRIFTSRNLLP